MAGVICGLGIVTKLTFFPLILITFLCCRGLRSFLVLSASFLATAAIALIPIYSELARVFDWMLRLSLHAGQYGMGAIGFATERYPTDVRTLLLTEPFFAGTWVATASILLLSLRSRWKSLDVPTSRLTSYACIVFFVQAGSFLIIARESQPHYLIPVYISNGLNLVILWQLVNCHSRQPIVRRIGFGVGILLIVFGLSNVMLRLPKLFGSLRNTRISELAIYYRVKNATKNAVRADYCRSIGPEFAMWFGNCYAWRSFSRILDEKFPGALYYNAGNQTFETFHSVMKPEDAFKAFDHLFLFGNRASAIPFYARSLDGLNVKNLKEVDRQGQYVLDEWTREYK